MLNTRLRLHIQEQARIPFGLSVADLLAHAGLLHAAPPAWTAQSARPQAAAPDVPPPAVASTLSARP